ncbi:heparinase II/III family protein [Rhodopirellula sp. MGV]|uniref:heparinase II/III family protein n=1 Tax=Rhodopirellula sp. MGV TaxID=2023130 RepID=UPI0013043A89|nr:heparinase II/III family protein [Rhodopirellula sp. MGV]
MRYHKPRQFFWRGLRMLQRKLRGRLPARFVFDGNQPLVAWKPNAKQAYRQVALQRIDLWPGRNEHLHGIEHGRFTFLNETLQLVTQIDAGAYEVDWTPESTRLWRFHLQSQEFLLKVASSQSQPLAEQIIASWLGDSRHQHPMRDPDAWHPFCISRRLPVWLGVEAIRPLSESVQTAFWQSLSGQIRWLSQNLELDLGGNHLLENLTALYLVACYLDGDSVPDLSWVETQLKTQLELQILPTGEHFERTPTYHALMLVCVLHCLEAANFAKSDFARQLRDLAARMASFMEFLATPNGGIPLLSDSVVAETPDLKSLFQWCDRLEVGRDNQSQVDYWKHQSVHGDQILIDLGPLACDHLPAHGHADLFQITASIAGKPAIVDTGNFQYEPGDLRLLCRGSAAHNVLQVGGRQHCDHWSSFRMGWRGHPLWNNRGAVGEFKWVAAAHDAFGFPAGRILLASESQWSIIDWFDNCSPIAESAITRLHWHPDWTFTHSVGNGSADLVSTNGSEEVKLWCDGSVPTSLKTAKGIYCPDFGVRLTNDVVELSSEPASRAWLRFTIQIDTAAELTRETITLQNGRLLIDWPNGTSLNLDLDEGHSATSGVDD